MTNQCIVAVYQTRAVAEDAARAVLALPGMAQDRIRLFETNREQASALREPG